MRSARLRRSSFADWLVRWFPGSGVGLGLGDEAKKNGFEEFDRGAVPHIALAAENGIDGLQQRGDGLLSELGMEPQDCGHFRFKRANGRQRGFDPLGRRPVVEKFDREGLKRLYEQCGFFGARDRQRAHPDPGENPPG